MTCLGLALAAVCCGLTLANASFARAAGEPTTYTASESVPVPPASNYAANSGGDGWSVALSKTRLFNVYHHEGVLQVVCHNQSDASVCFGPDTITDASGDNFATSGHSGIYLDQGTGKLWVYATRYSSDATTNATAGVVCIDTTQPASNTNPFCGFKPLTAAGDAPLTGSGISGLSNPVLYGNRLYAFNYVNNASAPTGSEDKMLCFDVSTDQACSGQPYAITAGLGSVSVGTFPTPPISLIGHQLMVPISDLDTSSVIACLDANTEGNCSGSSWPVALSSTSYSVDNEGPPFPRLDGTGNIVGFCLPDSTDECFGLDGSKTSTPPGMTSAIGGGSASWDGEALVLGPRVYVPAFTNVVYCYDASTQKVCPNFTNPSGPGKLFNGLGNLYTVNPDPQRPACMWVNSDGGDAQIQNFDAFTGGSCGQGPIRALASQFVVAGSQCTPNSYNYLQIVSPTPNQYSGGSVHFEDGDGNPIAGASDRPIDSTGRVNLTGLSLNSSTGPPQFLITLKGSENPGGVDLKLSWRAPYDRSCLDDDASATNPAGAAGASISAAIGPATRIVWYQGMLNGLINTHRAAVRWHFEYGPTTNYGQQTRSESIGAGHGLVPVSFPVSDLARGTVYHVRLVVISASGRIATSGDATFKTPSPSIHLAPDSLLAGQKVRLFGNAGGCPTGESVMLVSRAFSRKHKYLGEGAIFVIPEPNGRFSITTKIPKKRATGRYTITGRCGSGPWWFTGFPTVADVAHGRVHAANDAEGRRPAGPTPVRAVSIRIRRGSA